MTRIPALDGLRAVAVVVVVAFHTRVTGFDGGFIGVDIFFVLSGFLITRMLTTELEGTGGLDLRRFFRRRLVRLYPALIVLLVLFLIAAPLLFPRADPLKEALLAASYVSDYAYVLWRQPDHLRHTWSLAVEMQFYLLWPFALWAVPARHRRHLLAMLILLFLAATAWRWFAFVQWGGIRAYYAFDTRLSGLVAGAALAVSGWRPGKRESEFTALTGGALLLLAVPILGFAGDPALTWGGAVVELAAVAAIAAAMTPGSHAAGLLSLPPLVRIGKWSYGIYLFHYPVALLVRDRVDAPIAFAITLTVATAIAGISYELFEKKVARWLGRRRGDMPAGGARRVGAAEGAAASSMAD